LRAGLELTGLDLGAEVVGDPLVQGVSHDASSVSTVAV
jgi:hypothetical protein